VIPAIFATIPHVLESIAAATVVQCVTPILSSIANVLAVVSHILSTIPHVLATIPNVFAPVAPVFDSVAHDRALRTSMWVSVLRAQRGRGSSHQGRGYRSHSEIAHRNPQRQNPRSPSWRALLVRRARKANVKGHNSAGFSGCHSEERSGKG
jgi:hypothetical protein